MAADLRGWDFFLPQGVPSTVRSHSALGEKGESQGRIDPGPTQCLKMGSAATLPAASPYRRSSA